MFSLSRVQTKEKYQQYGSSRVRIVFMGSGFGNFRDCVLYKFGLQGSRRECHPNISDSVLYYTRLYYTVPYYTSLYYTLPYYTTLYYTILYCTILYYTIL